MPQHAPTYSNTLQSIVLRNVYYRIERVGASRSMLGHYDANKPLISLWLYPKNLYIYYTHTGLYPKGRVYYRPSSFTVGFDLINLSRDNHWLIYDWKYDQHWVGQFYSDK